MQIVKNFNKTAKKPLFILMPLEGAFLIQLTSNFVSRINFTIRKKHIFIFARSSAVNGGNGGVQNKTLKNYSTLTTKMRVIKH